MWSAILLDAFAAVADSAFTKNSQLRMMPIAKLRPTFAVDPDFGSVRSFP